MMGTNRLDKAEKQKILGFACLAIAIFLCWKWQLVFLDGCRGKLYTDIPDHIMWAGQGDYGLWVPMIRVLFRWGRPIGQVLLATCMTANNLLSLFLLAILLRYLFPKLDRWSCFLAAELSALVGPWLIPGYQMGLYLDAYNGNCYHNLTLLFGRTLIPASLVFFLRCWENRGERLNLWDWLGLTVSLLINTGFKPSFAFAFLPAVAVMLAWDVIRSRGKNFKNDFLIGCAVLPTGIMCIWQYLMLFTDDLGATSALIPTETGELVKDEEAGIAQHFIWGADLVFLLVMYLRSLLLPFYTLALQTKKEESRSRIRIIIAVEAVALLEANLLVETGFRASHGNFDWGGLAMYPTVFAVAIGLLLRMLQDADWEKREDRTRCVIGLILLAGHLAVGIFHIFYFGAGGSYCFFGFGI